MLQGDALETYYGDSHILRGVALAIPKARSVGLLGRNGMGKTTLIRSLMGYVRPAAGRVRLDDEDITRLDKAGLRAHRRRTSMIFQHVNLLHARTVADNGAGPLEIAGVPKVQRQARVEELLYLVGLSEKAHAFPSQLSGGQKQRVGIARALASRPDILLCDEATSALDPETTASVLALLAAINRQLGLTIVLITHQLEVVKTLCDHAALLENGELIEHGKIAELLTAPWSRLRKMLLPNPEAERQFLLRHGIEERALCGVA